MMTTVDPATTYVPQGVANDVKFLRELETLLPGQFDARIYPAVRSGKIEKAHVITEEEISAKAIERLIQLAADWKLHLAMAFKNGKITINFSKE